MAEAAHTDAPGVASSGDRVASPWPRPQPVHAVVGLSMLVALVALAMWRSLAIVNADALLYGLISTEQLTLFYWGQDRLANLVPLLAWPVQQPMWNFVLQTAVLAASFFALLGCFVWFHASRSGREVGWSVVLGAFGVSGASALLLLTRDGVADFVLVQQYALSTLLYLVGLTWLVAGGRTWRRVAGALAILVATLVIPSIILLTPIAAVVARGGGVIRRLALAGAVSFAAFVVGSIASRVGYDGDTYSEAYSDFRFDRVQRGLDDALVNITDAIHVVPAALVGALAIGVLVARRRSFDPTLRWAYVLTAPIAAGWVLLFTANQWVEINLFSFRYYFPAFAAGFFVVSGAVTEALAWAAERRSVAELSASEHRAAARAVAAAAAVAVAAVAVVAASRVSIGAVDAGRANAELAAGFDADLMVGDYWTVWPAMFASRSDGGDLLVVSVRSDPLRGRVEQLIDSGSAVGVVCAGVDEVTCVASLSGFIGEPVQVVARVSEQPLVIDVAAG